MRAATLRSSRVAARAPAASGPSGRTTRVSAATAAGTPGGANRRPSGSRSTVTASCQPWKWSRSLAIRSRPLAARARRRASIVASVPDEVKRTRSTEATMAAIRSAQSISSSLPAPKWVPRSTWARTAPTTAGWAWPSSRAPWPMV